MQNLMLILFARRALEYDRRGFKHPFDSKAAKETIKILKNFKK